MKSNSEKQEINTVLSALKPDMLKRLEGYLTGERCYNNDPPEQNKIEFYDFMLYDIREVKQGEEVYTVSKKKTFLHSVIAYSNHEERLKLLDEIYESK